MIVPINIAEDRFDELATTFDCSKGSLPFTYLGLPLSLVKAYSGRFLAFGV
jgi:hypothetical protein